MYKKINFSERYLQRSFIITSLIALVTLSTGCNEGAKEAAPSAMPPAAVAVLNVQSQTVPYSIELPATLSGAKEVEVRARVAGILESRNFNEGDKISAGQSLFTIERETFDVEVLRAEAEFTASKARKEQTAREVKRLAPLRAKKSISQQELDDASSRLAIAKAEMQASLSRLKQAKLSLDYTSVKSPINGIVGREGVSEGTYIQGPQLLLTQLTQVDPIRLRFGLSAREQLIMRKDAESGLLTLPENDHWQTKVKLQDGSYYSQLGEVNFNDVRINPNTGTSEFQAIIPNAEMLLRPGQFVRVTLEGAFRHNVHVVPQRAVLDNGNGKFVYLMKKNDKGMTVAMPAPVEVAEWTQQADAKENVNVWVIRSGLNNGDNVIIDGMARIFFPGMPVVMAPSPAANTASAH
mgnify:CR=1 FL=1